MFIFAEKLAPRGEWIGYTAGAAMTAWGAWIVLARAIT
jgi:hypothetical protein